ncbi:Bcl-2-like protein 1, partial [Stegodyphus mimosarum]
MDECDRVNPVTITSDEVNETVATFVYQYLDHKVSENGIQWESSSRYQNQDAKIQKVGKALKCLADEFAAQFKQQFVDMCESLDVREETIKCTVEGVANELFSEGVKWSRIVAFFVFGGELAVHCAKQSMPQLIDNIAYSVAAYITEQLLPWINDNGGWEGLIAFNSKHQQTSDKGTVNGTGGFFSALTCKLSGWLSKK